jgi:pseudaminic acid synthase
VREVAAPEFTVGDRKLGRGSPVYIVAELSANHNGNLERALATVDAAAESGADAVKLQTYTPDTLTIDERSPAFVLGAGPWEGQTLYDLYRTAYLPWEWHEPIMLRARELGLDCFSAAFDPTAVEFLERLDVLIHKIASFELIDIPLIRAAAATRKPLILSTGMATLEEIDEAVGAARSAGAEELLLLKCTSAYPAPPETLRLRAIPDLEERFACLVGLSDHTIGIVAPVTAVALGAAMIEKHFTLSRADGGPDSGFSLEPQEFAELVAAVRAAEAGLGELAYGPQDEEKANLALRRSLYVVVDVREGEAFTHGNVRSIRPGGGLHTRFLDQVVGAPAARDIAAGTPLDWELIRDGRPEYRDASAR